MTSFPRSLLSRKTLGALAYRLKRWPHLNKTILRSYLARQETPRLHIGCGSNLLSDWLNSDYRPHSRNIYHLDATSNFPFPDNQFRYIFSEHMIEHIGFHEASRMFSESFRVLEHGGKIRISTPDIQFLINLISNSNLPAYSYYVEWFTDRFLSSAPYSDPIFVFNEYVRAWGHTFIYDEQSLRSSLEHAGFTDIVRCRIGCSQDTVLTGLEHEERMPAGFLALETLTLEARKP